MKAAAGFTLEVSVDSEEWTSPYGASVQFYPSWATPAPQPACAHTELVETGFGPAYCRHCDAKLRRNANWEWEVVG